MSRRQIAALLLALAAAPAFGQTRPSQLIVFGDSLVDTGNIVASVGGDTFNPRAAGYYPGQFSNGPNYATLLSRNFYGLPSRASLTGGTNFAFGGARVVSNAAYAVGGDPVPDLNLQLAFYLGSVGNIADPNALYVINAGGNDIFAVGANETNGVAAADYLASVAATIAGSVTTLQAAGARRFLVAGIPQTTATGFAAQSLLTASLNGLTLAPDTELTRFDYQGFFIGLATNPAAFGVEPLTNPGVCIGNRPVVATRIDCTGFFSFDGIHPTAQVQSALYRGVLGQLGLASVPEPGTWTLMLGGFGLVGASLRRRTAAAVRGAA